MPQNVMRLRVQRMSKYPLLEEFKFVDLMSMAQFYEERTFVYSEYLYKQGSSPDEIYLIEEGQFQFTKFFEDSKENEARIKLKEKLARKKNINKQTHAAIDFQDATQYNSTKPIKLKQFRVGTILGGIGQSIGEEEIILGKQKRLYNAKCTSTTNKVIVINKEQILKILNANPKLLEGLKIKLKEKQRIIEKTHKKLESIRLNMDNFVKFVQQQTSRQKIVPQTTQRVENSFKLPLLVRRNQTEIKRKKQSLRSLNQEKFTTRLSHDSLLSIDKLQKSQILSNAQDQIDQESQTFALTAFQNNSSLKKKLEEKVKLLTKPEDLNSYEESNYNDYIPLKASKSWNVKALPPQKLLAKQKYPGMIDSTALIKQKQHILGIRRKTNPIDDRTEFEQKHKQILKKTQMEKQQAQKASTAHSKQYMEKMLLTALRKAGYQETGQQYQQQIKKNQTSLTESESRATETQPDEHLYHYNQSKNLKADRITMKIKRKKKEFFQPISEVLERSPFDECYFGKISY